MPVRYEENAVIFEGHCSIDEAQELQNFISKHPDATINCALCEHAHTALVQILLCGKCTIKEPPKNDVFASILMPNVRTGETK